MIISLNQLFTLPEMMHTAFSVLLKNADFNMRRIFGVVIYSLCCLLKIAVGAFIDIYEFLGIPVNKGEP
jgi:hypothetical protein